MSRPVLTIVAGSNGCGKSTLTTFARTELQQFPILDPDAIAKPLQATADVGKLDIEAGKKVLRTAQERLDLMCCSFLWERRRLRSISSE